MAPALWPDVLRRASRAVALQRNNRLLIISSLSTLMMRRSSDFRISLVYRQCSF
jgi:hypothetical protein